MSEVELNRLVAFLMIRNVIRSCSLYESRLKTVLCHKYVCVFSGETISSYNTSIWSWFYGLMDDCSTYKVIIKILFNTYGQTCFNPAMAAYQLMEAKVKINLLRLHMPLFLNMRSLKSLGGQHAAGIIYEGSELRRGAIVVLQYYRLPVDLKRMFWGQDHCTMIGYWEGLECSMTDGYLCWLWNWWLEVFQTSTVEEDQKDNRKWCEFHEVI